MSPTTRHALAAALLWALPLTLSPVVPRALPGQVAPDLNPQTGAVTWGGDRTDPGPIGDFVPPAGTQQGRLQFNWTREGQPHPGYRAYDEFNATNRRLDRRFFRPDDRTITDWSQTLTNGDGTSNVVGGNIRRGSPWAFAPLADLPAVSWRVPDLAPSRGGLTIYTAVNLDRYLTLNPLGFLAGEWTVGRTLDELFVAIVGGQVAGLEGIQWATSPFVFDPLSTTGWVPSGGAATLLDSQAFQAANGPITILAEHTSTIPEPAAAALLALGAAGLYGVRRAAA